MMTQLQDASIIFKQMGGLHNAAISDGKIFEHRYEI
ncbi:formate dehydrogenase accessory protein [Staphylococcus epidermidis 36-1]|nr:formate dehydrogenase accessory protein [Staphylococcus epidermidis 36-1]